MTPITPALRTESVTLPDGAEVGTIEHDRWTDLWCAKPKVGPVRMFFEKHHAVEFVRRCWVSSARRSRR